MKKIIISITVLILFAGVVYGVEPSTTDQVYRDLAELRRQMVKMKKEMDLFVKEVASDYSNETKNAAATFGQDIRVDITENDKDVIVRADLPGMSKDKIEVTLTDKKILKIAGERQAFTEETKQGVVTQERMTGKFERVLTLPSECANSGIRASYKDGVLEVLIPKIPKPKEESVTIKVQ